MITGKEPIHPFVNNDGFPSSLNVIATNSITGLTIRQHFASTTKTPDFLLEIVNINFEEKNSTDYIERIKAIAKADAFYKTLVSDALIEQLNKNENDKP